MRTRKKSHKLPRHIGLEIVNTLISNGLGRVGGVLDTLEPGDQRRMLLDEDGYWNLNQFLISHVKGQGDCDASVAVKEWLRDNHAQFGCLSVGYFLEFDQPGDLLEFRLKTGL